MDLSDRMSCNISGVIFRVMGQLQTFFYPAVVFGKWGEKDFKFPIIPVTIALR